MAGSESDQQYPNELLEARRIEDGRLYTPLDVLFEALEELLVEREMLRETGTPYSMSRLQAYGKFIGSMSQVELFEEMGEYSNQTVALAAKQINPEHKPRTKSTYEYLVSMTQETAPRLMPI